MTDGENEIRAARAADCMAIVACVRATYTKCIARMGAEPAPMLADYPGLIARGVIHILEELTTGELRGLIVLWPTDGAMFIDNVAVDPQFQGQGLGRQLLAFAEQQARSAGLPEVRLYTNEATTENLAFYGRLGFEETGRRLDEGYKPVFLCKMLDLQMSTVGAAELLRSLQGGEHVSTLGRALTELGRGPKTR